MNPSTNQRPIKNGTFCRLKEWMDAVGIPHWDFHNVVPDKTGDVKMEDVDWDSLYDHVKNRKIIICLGVFVTRVGAMLKKDGVTITCPIISLDHPSPRNRNFNDPSYEPEMLRRLKKELKDAGL
jgi:hypothetical protein